LPIFFYVLKYFYCHLKYLLYNYGRGVDMKKSNFKDNVSTFISKTKGGLRELTKIDILGIVATILALLTLYIIYFSYKYINDDLKDNINILESQAEKAEKFKTDLIMNNQLLIKENENLNGIISSLDTESDKPIIVKTPVYKKVTNQIAENLVGKYIYKEDESQPSYFEIKADGTFVIFENYCEGTYKLTEKELDFYAYYQKENTPGAVPFERTVLIFVLKPGAKYLTSDSNISFNFNTTDSLESKNIKFSGNLINCSGNLVYTKE
jgi:hypothetical protein